MDGATHILATDLDGTLVGDKAALDALWQFYKEQTYNVSLIYVTGRHFRSALSLIESEGLPVPDVLVTDVGTEIRSGRGFKKDAEWEQRMTAGWELARIQEIAGRIPALAAQELPVTCRASFRVTEPLQGTEEAKAAVRELERELKAAEISHKLIFSSGRDVDILPAGSGKGEALRYLIEKYGLSDAKILVAGDSGNDLEMLTLGLPAVMVGNARPELLETEEHPMIFRASRHCAGGIQEAWTYFHSS